MTDVIPYIKINIVRKKFGETEPDKYYMETTTNKGFNTNGNLENDKVLYEAIGKNLKLHGVKELNLKIFLRSNIFSLEIIRLEDYKRNFEEDFDEIGETGLRRLEGKLLVEGYNISQRIQVIGGGTYEK